ncbi:CobW family GTP-binding protein [Kingella negevensis]|uniref:CobW family GTP-binding protein n=1 Tax=Kingella negevensis TaxID=1522312 RepID=UPI0005C6C3D3|nr:GTP-binding protein [Kingella negevensis]
MKILIITGFLGAGKTRFIQEMARQTGQQFVILENEFGKLGLDGARLQESTGDQLKVWELSEGCICCSLDLDFTYTVLTIANSLNPDYLVIEPSGVAMPSNIIAQLNKIAYERITLAAPIVLIDGAHYQNSRAQFADYFQDQLSSANTVVVSKTENWRRDDFAKLREELSLSTEITLFETHYSHWSREQWQSLLETEMQLVNENGKTQFKFKQIKKQPENPLANISIESPYFANIGWLDYALRVLVSGCVGKIARAKGCCEIAGHWVKFDLVNTEYAITGSESMEDSRAVVIGQNFNHDAIKMLFQQK